jgi:hypothetical protein
MTKNTRDPQMDVAPIPRDIGDYKWKNPNFVVPVKPKDMDKLYRKGRSSVSGSILAVWTFIVIVVLMYCGLYQYPQIFSDVVDTFTDELKYARYNQYQKKVHDVAAIKNKPRNRKKWEEALSTYGSYAATSIYWVYYNHMDKGKTWFDYYYEDDLKNKKDTKSSIKKYQVPAFDDVDKVIKQKYQFARTGDTRDANFETERIRYTQVALLQMMRSELRSTLSPLCDEGKLPTDKFLMKYGC